jgi:hypothetical protein
VKLLLLTPLAVAIEISPEIEFVLPSLENSCTCIYITTYSFNAEGKTRGLMRATCYQLVMAGLVPAIHVLRQAKEGVDARIRGHDVEAR